jgi:hypothetical protein
MPQVNDSSDYTRRLKLRAVSFGNQAADDRKFRAPTSLDSYDPSIFRNEGGKCNDLCFTVKHSVANLMRLPYKAPAAVRDRYGSFGGVRS